MQPEENKPTPFHHPGVRAGAAGVVCVVVAILWTMVVPTSDTPIGGAEVLAIFGALLVIGGAWRGATAFAEDDGRPRE